MDARQALQRLKDGHSRFFGDNRETAKRSVGQARLTAGGQRPFAVIVSCSDSRIPPELLFDAGFGELFVIRTAGNVVSDYDLASIEYAVTTLGVRLIVVKGHSSCGAITAAVEDSPTDSVHLTSLIKAIQPVVREHMTIDEVTIAHTKDIAHAITERSSILGQVKDLMITSCFYRIDTGEMVWK